MEMPATASRNGSANNSQAFAYFGWLTLLLYLSTPLGTLVESTEQAVVFGGPVVPLSDFHDVTPPRAAFPRGYDMPSAGRPRAKENARQGQRCHSRSKISLSNRFYVSERLGSPCLIPQPV